MQVFVGQHAEGGKSTLQIQTSFRQPASSDSLHQDHDTLQNWTGHSMHTGLAAAVSYKTLKRGVACFPLCPEHNASDASEHPSQLVQCQLHRQSCLLSAFLHQADWRRCNPLVGKLWSLHGDFENVHRPAPLTQQLECSLVCIQARGMCLTKKHTRVQQSLQQGQL